MTSHGRKAKVTEVFLNTRDHNRFKCHGVTLRHDVDNRLPSSTADKIVSERSKKLVIVDNLYPTSRHKIIRRQKGRDLLVATKSIEKSLRMKLEKIGSKTSCYQGSNYKQLETREPNGVDCTTSELKLTSSSAAVRSSGVEHTRKQEKQANGKKTSKNCLQGTESIYSRHIKNGQSSNREIPQPDFSESNNNSLSKDFQDVESELPASKTRDNRRANFKQCLQGRQRVILDDCTGANCSQNDTQTLQEDISSRDEKVLNSLTDKQLKESLKNIMKRRRSSIRFVKSDYVCEVLNLEATISEQLHTDPEPNSDQEKFSVSTRKISQSRQFLSSVLAPPRVQPSGKPGRDELAEQSMPPMQTVSPTRSFLLTAPLRRLSAWQKPALETAEIRVIRPALAKGYVPNLTNRKVFGKRFTNSSPVLSARKEQGKNFDEENEIREFLLTYAKVSTENKHLQEQTHEPVRMLSQTPELVIKSAIGQFLTHAFPSGEICDWNGLKVSSPIDGFEEQQRCKLLRIKTCMKHLAAVA